MTQFPPPTDFSHGRPKRKGIMLAYPYDEERLEKWNTPFVYVQPKLDGVRCRVHWIDNRRCQLLSSTGEEIISVPHINRSLQESSLHRFDYDGELYCPEMSFEQIFSITSRTANLHEKRHQISFSIFDIKQPTTQTTRLAALYREFTNNCVKHLEVVRTRYARGAADIFQIFTELVADGNEGIIVRHPDLIYEEKRSLYMMKFKPKKSDIYKVVGFKQLIDKYGSPRLELGALICEKDGQQFSVGSGFTHDQRIYWWSLLTNGEAGKLVGSYVEIAYQSITPGRKVPRFPVFLRLLTEEEYHAKQTN